METCHDKAHLPGADREWELELEIDWDTKEINVHIEEALNGITDWPSLVINTFGPRDEIAFRTKGIPPHCLPTGGILSVVVMTTYGASY